MSSKEKESTAFQTEVHIQESSKIIYLMAKVSKHGQMVAPMKVGILMVKKAEWELIFNQMVKNI